LHHTKEVKAWKNVPPKSRDKKSNKVGKYTYHLCKHHTACCMHKPSECCLGKEQKEAQQKTKPAYTTNSATYATAAASMVDPHFQALLATIGTALRGWDKED
jgi:hypothetical protein